jgi:hypothetical protein
MGLLIGITAASTPTLTRLHLGGGKTDRTITCGSVFKRVPSPKMGRAGEGVDAA